MDVSLAEPPGAGPEQLEAEASEGFDKLVRYTLTGYAGGVVVGAILDAIGLQRSGTPWSPTFDTRSCSADSY